MNENHLRSRSIVLWVALVASAAGCSTRPLDGPGATPDSAPPELSDLGQPGAGLDLSPTTNPPPTTDLAPAPRDLGTPTDLAPAPRDQGTPTDLAPAPPDLTPPADLSYLSSDGGIDDGGCGIVYPTGSTATSYQIDPAHDGVQPFDRVATPLCQRWMAAITGALSYPVVANGRVFVTAKDQTGYGTQLYALDEHSGAILWGPIELGGTYYWSGIGWDTGRVFAVNGDGLLRAFAEDSGVFLWQAAGASSLFTASAPVATGGRVYVGSTGGFNVFDGATGALLWSATSATADHMTPAISGSTLYATRGCDVADAFDLVTQAPVWHGTASCNDVGGGGTAVYGGGGLYARSFYGDTELYDGASGQAVLTLTTGPAPAITPTLGYFVHGGDLQAVPNRQLAPTWTFVGNGVGPAPIVAGNTVVVAGSPTGSGGALWVLDATTGAVLSTVALPAAPLAPDEWNYSTPVAGLAVADGMIFVPTEAGLVAY